MKQSTTLLGIVGLGKMGYAMAQRLLQHGITPVVQNRTHDKALELASKGAIAAQTVEELVEILSKKAEKKIVWLMLPAGQPTEQHIDQLLELLNEGDILIDGANAFYEHAQRHARLCEKKGIHFFDIGVSGGQWGLQNGYPLMVGGPEEQFHHIEPYLKALSSSHGYGHFGPAGSGHFVKSVHNIVEYVFLQGLAEGVELLKDFEHPIDIKKALSVWQESSIVSSWLLDRTIDAVNRDDFEDIGTEINSVTIDELQHTAQKVKGFTPAFDVACEVRKKSLPQFELGKRLIAAIRREFGGHSVVKEKDKQ